MRLIFLLFISLHLFCRAAPLPAQEQSGYLRVVLQQADEAYYNRGDPIMDDVVYDALRMQYDKLLARYPELGSADKVGAPIRNAAERVEHSSEVLSLKKAYSDEEVLHFISKCGKAQQYCVEPKIDGLSLVLRYRDGLLMKAVTRGDGRVGLDATAAILASGAVPVQLEDASDSLEVRGELFMTYAAFDALNRRRAEKGETVLKSSRNTAAGALKLQDFGEIARRKLEFRVFELLASEPMPPTHIEALARVRAAGLKTIESRAVSGTNVVAAIAELNKWRTGFAFASDGIVIRLDDRTAFGALGATAHHPRGALARKYKAVPVETRILSVEWKRGKTGRLTPVAIFEPIELQGATVRRASLHSLAHLRALDLRLGDWVQVVRAGDAIPNITGVNMARRTGAEQPVPDPPPDL